MRSALPPWLLRLPWQLARSPALRALGLGLLLSACGEPRLEATSEQAPEITPAPATLHRLTREQYQATVRDLFGDWIRVPTDLEADTPLQGYRSVGAAALTISPQAADQYEAAALSLAQQAFADAARRQALLGCAVTAADDDCARGALARLGRRVFRRPLTDGETERLLGLSRKVAAALKRPAAGLEYATAALLQSPSFLFRVERGEPDPAHPGRLRYSAYELASRLSFFLWNQGPDEQLLSAAARGDLLSDEGLRAEAERLLASPRARAALAGFFSDYFLLDRLETTSKDRALFPRYTPALSASMAGEVLRAVDDLVFTRDGDYRDLFDGDSTFVNGELAAIYGLPKDAAPGADFVRVRLPPGPRGGLLGTAALLTINAHATLTSPTRRGKFIRQQLLCQDIPPPPPGVVTSLEPPVGGGQLTLRERLRRHREDPACRGCHERMDPLGVGLEHFDAIGALRDRDAGQPIDGASVLDGAPFEGARQLGALLKGHPNLAPCLVRQLYRHATGHLEGEGEQRGIDHLARRFSARHRVKELLIELVLSDGFRAAGPAEQQAP